MHVCTCLSLHVCLGVPAYYSSAISFQEGTLTLSGVCLPLTVALLPSHTRIYVCLCVCVCVRTCALGRVRVLVFVLLLICVLDFFHFNPIWVGQVGHCLLHNPGKLCQRGICTVDRTKYVYEEATMVTGWCRTEPSSEGVLTFIYFIAIWTLEYK